MSTLVTADLHLDSNPQNADRWNLFPWLKAKIKALEIKQLLILGDLTNEKDRHAASLVNRIVNKLGELSQKVEVIVDTGNHDFIDPTQPFFSFLANIPNIHFIIEPEEHLVENKPALFLPCTREWKQNYGDLDFDPYKYIFTHQTYDGAIAENGIDLRGIPPAVFSTTRAKVFSGDIHVPQSINKQIEYVGSPYHVHFGDTFLPRVLHIATTRDGSHQQQDWHFPFRRREVITMRKLDDLKAIEQEIGTQVKIKVHLKRSEYPEWSAMRKAIQALVDRRGWELCGIKLEALKMKDRIVERDEDLEGPITPESVLNDYAIRKKLEPEIRIAGKQFIKEAQQ